MKNSVMIRKLLFFLVGIFIVFGLYNIFNNYSLNKLYELNSSNYNIIFSSLFLSFLFYVFGVITRAIRLFYLSNSSGNSLRELIYLQFLTTATQLIMPFRMGDIARIYYFRDYFNGIAESTFLFVIEKILDTITLLSLLILSIWSNNYLAPFLTDSRLFILFSIIATSLYILPDITDIFYKHLITTGGNTRYKIFFLKISREIILARYKTLNKLKGRKINVLCISYVIWAFDCLSFSFIITSLKADQLLTFMIGPLVALSGFLPSPPSEISGSVNIGFYWTEIISGIEGLRNYYEIYPLLIYGSFSLITFLIYFVITLRKYKIKKGKI